MQQYQELLRDILANGNIRGDRTGTGTRSVFGRQIRFNLADGFPLVTLKRTPFDLVVAELIWFLEGSVCNNRLRELSGVAHGKRGIWDQWAVTPNDTYVARGDSDIADFRRVNELGPIYGHQWRRWSWLVDAQDEHQRLFDEREVDQIKALIKGLIDNPYSRRHIVSAWNVADLPDETVSPQRNVIDGKMSLAPCHTLFQCYVRDMTLEERICYYNDHMDTVGLRMGIPDDVDMGGTMDMLSKLGVPLRFLDLQLFQRSLDAPVGGPFNIASYSLLIHILARACCYVPGEFVWTLGDAHVYASHLALVDEMLTREPLLLPSFELPPGFDLHRILSGNATRRDVTDMADCLTGYVSHPSIKLEVAV